MKRGKKAQFYIIGAVIIIMAMISLASVSNYVLVKKEPAKFMDLGESISLEGYKVGEYGVFTNKDVDSIMGELSRTVGGVLGETNENIDMIIIHGNSTNSTITVISRNSTGTITANMGSISFTTENLRYNLYTIDTNGNNVNVTLLGVTYNFELGADEKFMFVMTKTEDFDNYVKSSQNKNIRSKNRRS